MVKTITAAGEFGEAVNSSEICVIDFYADWCGPCLMISPMVDKLDEELNADDSESKDRVKFCKVDVDKLTEVAQENGITAMPTFLIYQKARLVTTIVGADINKLTITIKSLLEEEAKDESADDVDATPVAPVDETVSEENSE